MSTPTTERADLKKFARRYFKHYGAALGCLFFLAGQAHSAVIVRNETQPVFLPVSLGGENTQQGALVRSTRSDAQFDPTANSFIWLPQALSDIASTSQAVSNTLDTNLELGDSGFTGSTSANAGSGVNTAELEISYIDVNSPYQTAIATNSAEYQTVRFTSTLDKAISVDASYIFSGSAFGGSGSFPGQVNAAGVLQVFDLASFAPTSIVDGLVTGNADVAIIDVQVTQDGSVSIDALESFDAWTNRDYMVLLTASVRAQLDRSYNFSSGIMLNASTSAPVFSVSDPSVSIISTSLRSNTASVDEPSIFVLLGLGFAGLCLVRRKKR